MTAFEFLRPPGSRVAAGGYPWSHEIELLLACARREMRDEDAERAARAVAAGVDWARVIEYARAHRLVPLLQLHAARAGAPAAEAEELKARAASIARRNLRLSAELIASLRAFADAGVRAVPLKGPLLAEQVYGSVALREIDDLDLLVDPAGLDRAAAALAARGYVRATPLPAGFDWAEAELMYHVSFRSPAGPFRVELHHALLPPIGGRRHGVETLPLVPGSFLGVPVEVLTPEAQFAYLCQHGAWHAWSRIEWLATAAALLRSGHVRDPARVDMVAAAWKGRRRVAAARLLADRLLGDGHAIPPEPSASLDRANRAVVRVLAREPSRTFASARERLAYQLRTDDDLRSRVARVRAEIASPRLADLNARALPRRAWPLYVLLRPLRLAAGWISGGRRS